MSSVAPSDFAVRSRRAHSRRMVRRYQREIGIPRARSIDRLLTVGSHTDTTISGILSSPSYMRFLRDLQVLHLRYDQKVREEKEMQAALQNQNLTGLDEVTAILDEAPPVLNKVADGVPDKVVDDECIAHDNVVPKNDEVAIAPKEVAIANDNEPINEVPTERLDELSALIKEAVNGEEVQEPKVEINDNIDPQEPDQAIQEDEPEEDPQIIDANQDIEVLEPQQGCAWNIVRICVFVLMILVITCTFASMFALEDLNEMVTDTLNIIIKQKEQTKTEIAYNYVKSFVDRLI